MAAEPSPENWHPAHSETHQLKEEQLRDYYIRVLNQAKKERAIETEKDPNDEIIMASTESSHAADQAGGDKEVVYASDGLEANAVEFPVSDNMATTTTEELDTSAPMTAEQAFEVFAGKLYVPNPYNAKQQSGAASTTTTAEGPLQRLGRLQREIAELQDDTKEEESTTTPQP